MPLTDRTVRETGSGGQRGDTFRDLTRSRSNQMDLSSLDRRHWVDKCPEPVWDMLYKHTWPSPWKQSPDRGTASRSQRSLTPHKQQGVVDAVSTQVWLTCDAANRGMQPSNKLHHFLFTCTHLGHLVFRSSRDKKVKRGDHMTIQSDSSSVINKRWYWTALLWSGLCVGGGALLRSWFWSALENQRVQ